MSTHICFWEKLDKVSAFWLEKVPYIELIFITSDKTLF